MVKAPLAVSEEFIEALYQKLGAARKYRGLSLPRDTVRDLVLQNLEVHPSPRDLEEVVRQKLHNLVAPYLGDPDYPAVQQELETIIATGDEEELSQFCLRILQSHASTRERLPILDDFYARIFSITGLPSTILDLACGLNPFALPWMGLPRETCYLAYDLHQPRVNLINAFLQGVHQSGAAVHGDILVAPPQEPADVAFFFKEAHRFEQRRKGCNREFFRALPVKYMLVSLPTESLTGRYSKLDQDRRLIESAVSGTNWEVSELLFDSEIVFCIRKDT
ncbi:MAG TPA: hypothetical protein PK040_02770 [Anaerolineaceae bacterium]|nr:hypothetical protein [Anaerolineaceae bacterium]